MITCKRGKACATYSLFFVQAFVIALTSDFIPRMVYLMVHSENYTMDGYINYTLSGDHCLPALH